MIHWAQTNSFYLRLKFKKSDSSPFSSSHSETCQRSGSSDWSRWRWDDVDRCLSGALRRKENSWMGRILLNNLYLPFICVHTNGSCTRSSVPQHSLSLFKQFEYWEGSLHCVTSNCRRSEIDFMRLISTDEVETHWECSPGRGWWRERAGQEINTLRLPLCCRSARFFYSVSPAESGTCSAPWLDSAREKKKNQQKSAWSFGGLNTKSPINDHNLWWGLVTEAYILDLRDMY